jgi:hypothetical protein
MGAGAAEKAIPGMINNPIPRINNIIIIGCLFIALYQLQFNNQRKWMVKGEAQLFRLRLNYVYIQIVIPIQFPIWFDFGFILSFF